MSDYSPSALIVGAVFVRLHVSLVAGLQAHGFAFKTARELVASAARAGQVEVRFELPATAAQPEVCTVILRRVRGNHAEEWRRAETPVRRNTNPETP